MRSSDFPAKGARVRLTHYATGNVLSGSQDERNLTLVGTVVETPKEGSTFLCVRPDPSWRETIHAVVSEVLGGDKRAWDSAGSSLFGRAVSADAAPDHEAYALLYDTQESEAWSVSTNLVSLSSRVASTEWTIEPSSEPAPEVAPEPVGTTIDIHKSVLEGWTGSRDYASVPILTCGLCFNTVGEGREQAHMGWHDELQPAKAPHRYVVKMAD